jgi:hypothetical protein
MKPVKQTTPRNCMAACTASIMEIECDDVPHFFHGDKWDYLKQVEWLAEKGWAVVEHKLVNDSVWPPTPGLFCIICGDSPRNAEIRHAVVARTGKYGEFDDCGFCEMVHDPHESNAGIAGGEPDIIRWMFPIELAQASENETRPAVEPCEGSGEGEGE